MRRAPRSTASRSGVPPARTHAPTVPARPGRFSTHSGRASITHLLGALTRSRLALTGYFQLLAAERSQAEGPHARADPFTWFVESRAVVMVEHRHDQLGNEPCRVFGIRGVERPNGLRLPDLLEQQVCERPSRRGHLVRVDRLEPPVLRRDEAGAFTNALQPAHGGGDIQMEAIDRIGQFARPLLVLLAVVIDDVLDDGEKEMILAGKIPVERLERDARFLDQFLGREARALGGNEALCGLDDRVGLLHSPALGALHKW